MMRSAPMWAGRTTRLAPAWSSFLSVEGSSPRAMIDLNRDPGDVDWEMFAQGRPNGLGSYTPGLRARSGLGLIPRRFDVDELFDDTTRVLSA